METEERVCDAKGGRGRWEYAHSHRPFPLRFTSDASVNASGFRIFYSRSQLAHLLLFSGALVVMEGGNRVRGGDGV